MRPTLLFILSSLLLGSNLFAQQSLQDNELFELYNAKKDKAVEYALRHDLPLRKVYADGTIIEIQYLDDSGKPVYYKTMNVEAASTTGTTQLYEGAELGLNLSGVDFKFGIWDGGLARATHDEFNGRVINMEGSSVSNHSTHVTGTILAQGLNNAAKGMAFKAHSVSYDGLNGDVPEMDKEAKEGLLISNHSYGEVLGWNQDPGNGSWEWNGDASINPLEDYRFGYYSSESARWDEIAYKYPQYLMVKSAGNDRTDVGNGSPGPDGPYDIIGPQGVAKNILTVGSVQSISGGYIDRSSVQIAAYSSWGPTDDGRIKPDIMGVGENVFSTSSSGDDQYTTLSGTSMSSPNVAGSLALLQQLYFKLHNQYLLSSSLKGLAIHTAFEAGSNPGPDYQYGWGLLNVEDAAKLLMLDGTDNYAIKEVQIENGQQYNDQLNLMAGQKVTLTICWTDPEGEAETVASLNPTNLKLVNDLDLRVIDPSNGEYLPWIIDPATKKVETGDNFRDNVEKIEFTVPADGLYEVTISHKDTLINESQVFSYIYSVGGLSQMLRPFYFLGVSSNFNDLNNWSATSGGAVIGEIPSINDLIIFDDNSVSNVNSVVMPTNSVFSGISSSGTAPFTVDLNGGTIFVKGNVNIENMDFSLSNGALALAPNGNSGSISIMDGSLLQTNLIVDAPLSNVNLLSDLVVDTVEFKAGNFYSNGYHISTSVVDQTTGNLFFDNSIVDKLDKVVINDLSSTFSNVNTKLLFNGSAPIKELNAALDLNSVNVFADTLMVYSVQLIDSLEVSGTAIFHDSISVTNMVLNAGSSILIGKEKEVFVLKQLTVNSAAGSEVNFKSYNNGLTANGSMRSEITPKFCLDYVSIDEVDVTGNSKFVIGANSTLTGSVGWIEDTCENVLAAEFGVQYTCSGGISEFIDLSDGEPQTWSWDFGDETLTSSEQNPKHIYTEEGIYSVQLIIDDGTQSSTVIQSVIIESPSLGTPQIVIDNDQLRTTAFADNYQWYFDNTEIPGATDFFLSDFSDPGLYHIEIWNTTCRLRSEPFVITGIENQLTDTSIFPNPFKNSISIQNPHSSIVDVFVYDHSGRILIRSKIDGTNVEVDMSSVKSGIYFVELVDGTSTLIRRMIKID